MTRDEAKELIPLYALGALDEETAGAIEEHLRSAAPEELREAAALRETAQCLPFALPQPPVPAAAKQKLLARINALESQPELAETRRPASTAQVIPFTPKPRVATRLPRWLPLAAALLLAVTSAALFWQNRQLERERAALATQLRAAQESLTTITQASTRVIAMNGEAVSQAHAKVVWDTAQQRWVIYVSNLPAPPDGKDYQLWYVTKNARLSAAVFRPDRQGRVELRLSLPREIAQQLAATAVTLEPQGGSAQPTGEFVLKAAI